MILSVIIVHYRVPYFLELCLHSVRKALEGLDAEIIVVDNHSADGSLDFLRPLFPEVNWIANPENTGFARANNQALKRSTGDYLLFLNPDTVVSEDFARECLAFIRSAPHIGGLGVRMIDGNGQFLRESRRGFPSPWVAFCKLSGLTALFPRSRHFARYYLGHLPADRPHPAPVLSGACLWVSRNALETTGSFDENFFMYAEDIDLSYRLEKAGFTNYYYPGTTLIHFKGESTSKDLAYVRQFYKAMIQFHRKHFSRSVFSRTTIEIAVRLRAALSAFRFRTPARFGTPARFRTPGGSRAAAGSKPRRTWLTGDPEAIARLLTAFAAESGRAIVSDEQHGAEPGRTIMSDEQHAAEPGRAIVSDAQHGAEPGRTIVSDAQHADEILYCIGKEFSFKSAIGALQAKSPAQTAAFHAVGCHAVLSSSRRDGQGEIWVLQG